ncbi:intracellular growth attenuator family protein [Candidatus Soleaferrea massiliensis]|uniref:intracellular growth attenuator family protein n=1 Tax=Candidatus Soleaferrea massiliensis TaxID=1470354 RepID=UPI000AE88795|nr:intracellular growth attenuator family protein [Candidatus Soleaferrea massiliensis]
MMNWLRRFMMGRYGADQLSFALLILYFVLTLVSQTIRWPYLMLIALLPIAWCFFRMLSRNVQKRYAENLVFLKFWNPVKGWFSRHFGRMRDKTHRYYRCPQCSQQLRVPKGRGKIEISCPKCHTKFIKKT